MNLSRPQTRVTVPWFITFGTLRLTGLNLDVVSGANSDMNGMTARSRCEIKVKIRVSVCCAISMASAI